MSALVWDQVGDRSYELGVSKGVLYDKDGLGVVWNGLTSIRDGLSTEVEAVYFDGVKVNDVITVGDFNGTISAITYPDEFLAYEGTIRDQTGFYVTGQSPERFGLAYQTKIPNDVDDSGYKLHLLYNLTAIPSDKTYETLSLDVSPMVFEWEVTSVPEEIDTLRATAHVILDSREMDPGLLSDLEDILYGTEDTDPHLPSLQGLVSFIRQWNLFIISIGSDGTWTATTSLPYVITMLDADTFQIDYETADFIDADSYTISSSEKNEDDLWLP